MLPTTHLKFAKVNGELICQSVEFTNNVKRHMEEFAERRQKQLIDTREKYRALLDEALREAKDEGIEVSSKTLANANEFIDNQSFLEFFDFPTISVECDIQILFEWHDKSKDDVETIFSIIFQQGNPITAFRQWNGAREKYDTNIRYVLSNFIRKNSNG